MRFSQLILLVLTTGLLRSLSAADAFKLELEIFVFRDADFEQITLGSGLPVAEGRGEVFAAPAVLNFGKHSLKLTAGERSWDTPGKKAPASLSPVSMPTLVVAPLQEASVRGAMPLQYIEKMPDGSLQVRNIESDSPEAPRYQLSLQAGNPDETGSVSVTFHLELATVSGREKIAGVDLDVGRPILARLTEGFQLRVRPGDWSGFVLRRPQGGNYGLLLLLKATSVAGETVATGEVMTAEELDRFVSNYYRQPRPERIAAAVAAMDRHRVLDPNPDRQFRPRRSPAIYGGFSDDTPVLDSSPAVPKRDFWVYVGFLAEVIAANPGRVAEWEKVARKGWLTRDCFRAALKFRTPGALLAVKEPWIYRPSAILTFGNSWGGTNSALWGAFYASGNPAYVHKLIEQLRHIGPQESDPHRLGAMWSLAVQAPEHEVVRTSLEMAREQAEPRLRAVLDDVLANDLTVVQRHIALIDPRMRQGDSAGYKGLRDSGYYGPVSPAQEMPPK
jgi:hypothetical protein